MKYALIVVGALVLITSLFAHVFAKKAIAWAVGKETGLAVEIGGLKTGKLSPWFEITDFRLMGAGNFADEACVHIKRLHVAFNPASLFSDNIRVSRISLDIPRVLIIEEEEKSNIAPLMEKQFALPGLSAAEPDMSPEENSSAAKSSQRALPKRGGGHKNVSIGNLELKLGTIELRRRAEGEDEPMVQEFDFDETYVFTNVTGAEQILQRLAASFFIKQMSTGTPSW